MRKTLLVLVIIVGIITSCSTPTANKNEQNGPNNEQVEEGAIEHNIDDQAVGAEPERNESLVIEQEAEKPLVNEPIIDVDLEQVEYNPQVLVEPIVKKNELPKGFVYLDEIVPYAIYDIRYYSTNNFVGHQIKGYNAPLAIGTLELANALVQVSEELYEQGYTILIYDTYRPAKAVTFFKSWATNDDETMKQQYYPNEEKSQLFKRGYLASKSGHSRGSTVDLTLVHKDTNELVDMGSEYDMLDEISSFNTNRITKEQAANRNILKETMIKHGFKEYSKEWWHYVLKTEPYSKTYFDFNVE